MDRDSLRENVVVGVRGVHDSTAVEWALRDAARRGDDLLLVHADGRRHHGHRPAVSPPRTTALDRAARLAHQLAADIQVRQLVVDGRPGPGLLSASRDASTLVLGARTWWLPRSVPGSATDFLLRHVRCPLVVARGSVRESAPVVVGVDGSIASQDALAYAARAAAERGVPLLVAHIWSEPPDDEPGVSNMEELTVGMFQSEIALAGRPFPRLDVDFAYRRGSPAAELATLAESAQLLVVGSHCRGPLRAAVFGSVSSSLLRVSPCAVAVVRPHVLTDREPSRRADRSIA